MKKLNTKYLKTGGYAVLMSLIVLAIVIFVNVFVNKLPATQTKIDLSSNDMYSIGEKTINLVGGLKKDVTIYYIAKEGEEIPAYTTVLSKYEGLSVHVTVKNVDPAKDPNFLSQKEGRDVDEYDSLIIECGDKIKVVDLFDVYFPGRTDARHEEIKWYIDYYNVLLEKPVFDLENQLTTAISFVISEESRIVYSIGGHGEKVLMEVYKEYLESKAIELRENLVLATAGEIPEDADCVLLCRPTADISAQEKDILLNYLKNGGRMVYYSDYLYTSAEKIPNITELLDYYGVSADEGIIYEGDSSYHYNNSPTELAAQYGEHEIVAPLKNHAMIIANCQGINIESRDNIKVTPLLFTTDKAFARVGTGNTNEKVEGDIDGPFDYAVAITETVNEKDVPKIVWVNTTAIIDPLKDEYGNFETIFLNTFGWICDVEDAIMAPSKAFSENVLEINAAQSKVLLAVFAVIIPGVFVGLGAVVWFRRRSK